MSKESRCLKRIDERIYITEREHKEFLKVVEQAVLALDIIKEKNVDTKYLISIIRDKSIKDKDKLWIYNSSVSEEDELTNEEFEILKECFKWQN